MTDFAPGAIWPEAPPLGHALVHVGEHESGGPNRGPLIDKWLKRRGLDAAKGSYPWCAAFVCAMVEDAGWHLWGYSAGVVVLLEVNRVLEVVSPEPGDILLHIGGKNKNHCGFFLNQTNDSSISSVDGNTDDKGSREGVMVAIKSRPRAYWTNIIRPRKVL